MNREQVLSIFCELVDRLREKREFEVIEAAYNRLRKCDFIPPPRRRFYKRKTG